MVNLTRGGFSGGYRKYLQQMIPRLQRDARVSRLDVYSARIWPAREYRRLQRTLRASRPDVVFVPTGQTIDCGRPVVMMIRNMEPLLVPFDGNTWPEGVRNLVRAGAMRRSARRSDRVIAVSRHVRDFLMTRWDIAGDRIGLVYHGVDSVTEQRRPFAAADVAPGSFLFTAGSIRPARGLDDLVEALAQTPLPLLVAGEADAATRRYAVKMRRRAAGLPILWLGRLDPSEMSWCFRHCRAFVMTSRAEACPNTALEAMAYGCLSISTDCPPMPEFFGETAIYYRARNAGDLAARLAALRDMPEAEKEAFRQRARARAGQFTWDATASQTMAQLELALR
jgi:glycosyltransferase involved in cell wall biosynthesis